MRDLSGGVCGFDDGEPEAGFADGRLCDFGIVGGGLGRHLVRWACEREREEGGYYRP